MVMSSVLQMMCGIACMLGFVWGCVRRGVVRLLDKVFGTIEPPLNLDPKTDNHPVYFEAPLNIDQSTTPTTQFAGCYGTSGPIGPTGSTGYHGSTGLGAIDYKPQPLKQQPEPKPDIPNIDSERVIDLE